MIRIYTSPTCQSCRKVKKWFMDENIPFIEKNIFSGMITDKDILDMLTKSEHGTDDIISPRSKIVKTSGIDLQSLTLTQLVEFIKNNPSILKRPIIVDDSKIQVGYNSDEIRAFIPYAKRIAEWSCTKIGCPQYLTCEHGSDIKEEA